MKLPLKSKTNLNLKQRQLPKAKRTIPEYLAGLDVISQGDILQQANSSAANPEMISEQDGLMEESSPEKQTTAGNEPEANVSSIVNTTGLYSQIGVQGSSVDLEDDGITPQPQIDELSQTPAFQNRLFRKRPRQSRNRNQ